MYTCTFAFRPYKFMPPAYCWVATTLAFTEYRGSDCVSRDDVTRAMGVLLPSSFTLELPLRSR